MKQMCAFVITFLRARLPGFVIMLGIILPCTASAAEFTRFKLTGYRAFMQTLLRYDERTYKTAGGTISEKSPQSQRLLGGSTNSYVYHPNFLQMNISGSLLFDQRRYERDDSETENSGIAWNLSTQLNFLNNKPYPFSVFFRRNNPLVFVGTSDSFNQKNTSFGLNFSLLRPFSPVTVKASLTRDIQTGESFDFLQDDTTDQFTVNLQRSFFGEEHTELSYSLIRTENLTGNPSLTIQGIETFSHYYNFINRWQLGDRDQFHLSNVANYTLTDQPDRQNFTYNPHLIWYQTANMFSDYDYKFTMTTRGRVSSPDDDEVFTNVGRARLNLIMSERLTGNAGVRGSINNTDTLNSQSYGAFTDANYHRPTPVGDLAVAGGVAYDFNTQEATTPQEEAVDEALTLPGIGFNNRVPLANDFVVAGSVVVANAAPPFTPCTEGFEYELQVVGTQTLIELLDAQLGCFALTGPNLGPDEPEDIFVNYLFETGGTFNFSTLSSNISANLKIARYYDLYARFNDRRQTENDSTLTLTRRLNSVRSTEVGARANVPLWWNIKAGGEARFRFQDEEVSSFDSTTLNAWVSVPLPFRTSVSLSVNRSMTDLSDSPEDSDIIRYSARIISSPWRRLQLSADAAYEEDTGATIEIARTEANFRAEWQIRKLRLSAVARYQKNIRGDIDREQLEAWLLIRRDIW